MTASLAHLRGPSLWLALSLAALTGCSVIVHNETECNVKQDCDDNSPCTIDSCGSGGRCENIPIDCDDGNGCTMDSCNIAGECVHTEKSCDDSDACTINGCDTNTGECTFTFHDNDGDGFAPEPVCMPVATGDGGVPMEQGGDCDDTNNQVYPGATERCDTAFDDNCNGSTTDWTSSTVWYADADDDGFPNTAVSTTNCAKPAGYIQLRPDGQTDCADNLALVHQAPGTESGVSLRQGTPFCRKSLNDNLPATPSGGGYVCPAGYSLTYDYDCDNTTERFNETVNITSCPDADCGGLGSCCDGWTGAAAPACGASASYKNCTLRFISFPNPSLSCSDSGTSTVQQTCY